jgi:hypothetical protein
MKCARCGFDMPDGAASCPQCGLRNEFAPTKEKKSKLLPWVIAACAVLVIAVAALVFALMHRGNDNVLATSQIPPPPSANVVAAPPGVPEGGSVVQAPPGVPPPGDTTPPFTPKPKPPQYILDYLVIIKQAEDHRHKLLGDTTAAMELAVGGQTESLLKMIQMAGDPEGEEAQDPLADAKKEINRQYDNWVKLITWLDTNTKTSFDKEPDAAKQCYRLYATFRGVLYAEAKTIYDIASGMNSVNIMNPQDMSKLFTVLSKMKSDKSIQAGMDQASDDADARLTDLVSQYDMEKPFSITREQQSGGNIMGF